MVCQNKEQCGPLPFMQDTHNLDDRRSEEGGEGTSCEFPLVQTGDRFAMEPSECDRFRAAASAVADGWHQYGGVRQPIRFPACGHAHH